MFKSIYLSSLCVHSPVFPCRLHIQVKECYKLNPGETFSAPFLSPCSRGAMFYMMCEARRRNWVPWSMPIEWKLRDPGTDQGFAPLGHSRWVILPQSQGPFLLSHWVAIPLQLQPQLVSISLITYKNLQQATCTPNQKNKENGYKFY